MITDEQLDFIAGKVHESSIASKEVQDDLIDHFYCLIEEEIGRGNSFEVAYQKAFEQTTPNGFDEIQEEVFFILNFNKIMNMKRLTYITGFIFTLGLTAAVVFKLLHLPGAGVVLGVSSLGTTFVFVPMLLVSHLRAMKSQSGAEKAKWVAGTIGFMIFSVGIQMKMLHLAGAAVLLVVGGAIFALGCLPFLFYWLYKQSLEAA
jgi:hypothetical protein